MNEKLYGLRVNMDDGSTFEQPPLDYTWSRAGTMARAVIDGGYSVCRGAVTTFYPVHRVVSVEVYEK